MDPMTKLLLGIRDLTERAQSQANCMEEILVKNIPNLTLEDLAPFIELQEHGIVGDCRSAAAVLIAAAKVIREYADKLDQHHDRLKGIASDPTPES